MARRVRMMKGEGICNGRENSRRWRWRIRIRRCGPESIPSGSANGAFAWGLQYSSCWLNSFTEMPPRFRIDVRVRLVISVSFSPCSNLGEAR
ncbi:hypothetical protein BHE74_00046097 [Ensete ventricosum]|nr:hypothetical protein BHE74_00046097 [Ensete ventricosum]